MNEFMTIAANVLQPMSLLFISVGVVIGTVFGCIPGLSTPIALALILPITFVMDRTATVCIIMGIYAGGISGGLVSAITLKIPGSSASVATTFDGYPMAQQGRAVEALSLGVCSSFFGGIFSCIVLLICAPLLSRLAIGFGPWEMFGATLLALSFSCVMIKGNMIKGFISMFTGLLAACVGMSPIDGMASRFTFGNYFLENGFEMIAIVIGIFAMPEIISNVGKLREKVTPIQVKKKFFYLLSPRDIKKYFAVWLRSSVLGTVVGILPGMGGGPACLIAYAQEKSLSKNPETFGTGNPVGVAAPESANNATMGGALIPMLSLGVPGDTNTSIIMGALTIQGIAMGPLLLQNEPVLYRTIIFACFVANMILLLIQAFAVPYLAKIVIVPKRILLPIVTVFCVTGVVSVNNTMFDVYYMLAFVLLGYIFVKNGYPVAPMIVAFVLGEYVESGLRRAIVYHGSFGSCMSQMSVGTVFVLLAIAFPLLMTLRAWHRGRRTLDQTERDDEDSVGMND